MQRSGRKEVYGSSTITWGWYGGLKVMLAQHIPMSTNQYPHSMEETINIFYTYNETTRMQPCIKSSKKGYDGQTEAFLYRMQREKEQITT